MPTCSQPHAARYDKLGRQALGFPWLDHRTVREIDELEKLEAAHRTTGITPREFCRLRELRHRGALVAAPYRDAFGRFS